MAVPKRRTSRSRRGKRRSHDSLSVPGVTPCPQCGEMRLPHRVCPSCGYYRGKAVLEIEEV